MTGHSIICMGASAGGVEALTAVARGLPPDLPASVFIVLHVPPDVHSVLPDILNRAGPLPASHPVDGQVVQPGRIYVAPPDRHLLVRDGHLELARGARENGHRPSVDPLFRSAALWHDSHVVGVILSGTLDDGAAGLLAVKRRGGIAVVQDPDDAAYPGMPRNAAAVVSVDYLLRLGEIAPMLVRLASQPASEAGEPSSKELEFEVRAAEGREWGTDVENHPGKPSIFRCPDCTGVLWEIKDSELVRYRCRVGHAFAPESLLEAQSSTTEQALWTAMDTLEERASLTDRLGRRLRERGVPESAARFEEQARESREGAEAIRRLLAGGVGTERVAGDASGAPPQQIVAPPAP